jgi:hypothetical protein
MNSGFIKLNRGEALRELLYGDPLAFLLLAQVAERARRTDGYNKLGLEVGEALIGEHDSIGLTRQNYRTRLHRLVTGGFLTIRATNDGTIARLSDTRVFDINSEESNQQANHRVTIDQPSGNH